MHINVNSMWTTYNWLAVYEKCLHTFLTGFRCLPNCNTPIPNTSQRRPYRISSLNRLWPNSGIHYHNGWGLLETCKKGLPVYRSSVYPTGLQFHGYTLIPVHIYPHAGEQNWIFKWIGIPNVTTITISPLRNLVH